MPVACRPCSTAFSTLSTPTEESTALSRAAVRWAPFLGTESQESATSLVFRCRRANCEKTSEISTVPSFVKTPFAPLNSLRTRINTGADIDETAGGPLTEVTKTVRNVRNEIRANFNATDRRTEGAAANGLVQAQGEVRGAVGKAANDVVNALRVGKPSKVTEDGATGPTTVAKSFSDTAKKVVKQVRQAAKDAGDAAKDRVAADNE